MPAQVYGTPGVQSALDPSIEYDYEYPEGLDLKPGSELHQALVSAILKRATEAHGAISRRFSAWREIDQTLTSFITTDDAEELVKEKDERKPITIVFPYSYAMLETLLTYLTMAFFQDPIFKYEGTGPEDTLGTTLLELVVRLHCEKTKVALALHTHFRDSLAYGVGAAVPSWEVRRGAKVQRVAGVDGGVSQRQVTKDMVLFEGNRLDTIDPYRLLPDPSVPLTEIQRGEFVGWSADESYVSLLSKESIDRDLFNVRYLEQVTNKQSFLNTNESDRERRYGAYTTDNRITKRHDLIYMYIDLIPREWKLGERETPEKWLFCLASDSVILKARPAALVHNKFPISIAAPDFDGYSVAPISRLESMFGLQTAVNFLWNSHITNVRKAINDMLVVDPYLINIKDLENPSAGGLIRLRRPAWGRGVKDAVTQLGIVDITRSNIGDIQFAMQMMNRIAGADDAASGMLRQGGPERLTGSEFRGTRGSQVSRMERIARVISMQSMHDIGDFFASHTQQFMEQDVFVRATGQWQERLMRELGVAPDSKVAVTPMALLVEYDVISRDGSIPGGNFSEAWLQLFKIISENPLLAQKFDVVRIFSHIARNLGAKNVEDFEVKTMPNEQVAAGVQAGNLVPMPMAARSPAQGDG